jgi:hypothetical protein
MRDNFLTEIIILNHKTLDTLDPLFEDNIHAIYF